MSICLLCSSLVSRVAGVNSTELSLTFRNLSIWYFRTVTMVRAAPTDGRDPGSWPFSDADLPNDPFGRPAVWRVLGPTQVKSDMILTRLRRCNGDRCRPRHCPGGGSGNYGVAADKQRGREHSQAASCSTSFYGCGLDGACRVAASGAGRASCVWFH